jgi:hypothetical protein
LHLVDGSILPGQIEKRKDWDVFIDEINVAHYQPRGRLRYCGIFRAFFVVFRPKLFLHGELFSPTVVKKGPPQAAFYKAASVKDFSLNEE